MRSCGGLWDRRKPRSKTSNTAGPTDSSGSSPAQYRRLELEAPSQLHSSPRSRSNSVPSTPISPRSTTGGSGGHSTAPSADGGSPRCTAAPATRRPPASHLLPDLRVPTVLADEHRRFRRRRRWRLPPCARRARRPDELHALPRHVRLLVHRNIRRSQSSETLITIPASAAEPGQVAPVHAWRICARAVETM
jgi:hypothetical protein